MIAWQRRPVEVSNLLNPAFCGEVLRRCMNSYQQSTSQAFPYPLSFLVLPIVLHRRTRELISPRQKQPLYVWLESNPDAKIGFAERTAELVPITKEALVFLLQVGAVILDEQANLTLSSYKEISVDRQIESEIADCYKKAVLVGRWFARAGTVATIYTMWGVKP